MNEEIVDKYGSNPTICFFYYLWNAIDYAGEDCLRESFESIQNQGNEIIVGDYGSTDGTKELAKEYGFKVIDVEKTDGILFHTTKIINKIIFESKSNFIADLDIHITYPNNMDEIITNWIINNDITKKLLVIGGQYFNNFILLKRIYAVSSCGVFYRPYLLKARGYDERTYYRHGDSHYTMRLLEDVFKLEIDYLDIDNMIHKDHRKQCIYRSENIFDHKKGKESYITSRRFGRSLVTKLVKNFNKGIKEVRNSYW